MIRKVAQNVAIKAPKSNFREPTAVKVVQLARFRGKFSAQSGNLSRKWPDSVALLSPAASSSPHFTFFASATLESSDLRHQASNLWSFMPNTHRRRRRDATKQFRRVGGVYWAYSLPFVCQYHGGCFPAVFPACVSRASVSRVHADGWRVHAT